MRIFIYFALGTLGFLAVAFTSLMFVTRTPSEVLATVKDNPSLRSLEGDSVLLHGRVTGPEEAPLMIVLHGGPGSDFRSLLALENLAPQKRVLFYDQRGAGLSERVASDALSIAHHLADLDRLIRDHSNGMAVTLLGHSMGAALAVAYMGHAPENVANVILIEPGFLDREGFDQFEAQRQSLANSVQVIGAGILAGFRARNVEGDTHAAHDSIIGAAVQAFADHPDNPYHCGQGYSAPGWRFGGVASDTFWAEVSPALEAIKVGLGQSKPILFLAGECNTWIGEATQKRHVELFPAASLAVIPDAGHNVIWDNPEASIKVIRKFLSEG